jgi:hypothetical protein
MARGIIGHAGTDQDQLAELQAGFDRLGDDIRRAAHNQAGRMQEISRAGIDWHVGPVAVHFLHDALSRARRHHRARALNLGLAQHVRLARITEENIRAFLPEPRDQVRICIQYQMRQPLRVQNGPDHLSHATVARDDDR